MRCHRQLLFVLACLATPLGAQSWQLRLDANAQRVSFRGVTADSIRAADVLTDTNGGPITPDGHAVSCFTAAPYCFYFRPGAQQSGIPASSTLDLSMWGFGVPGLRLHATGRVLTDLSGDRLWPGTSPATRLIEGYAEYLRDALTVRLGRLLDEGRLGNAGLGAIDGVRAAWLFDGPGVEVGAYGGWGLARGTLLPVTSPAVNPLLDFQPRDRQQVFGASVAAHLGVVDARLEYRREVDPETRYFVAERAGGSLVLLPVAGLRLVSGLDYDLAQGRLGSAEATLRYSRPGVAASVGGRYYRPFFDLWTVWGAFSPVPYRSITGSLAVDVLPSVQLRGRGEWFRYDETETSTPTVDIEDGGHRLGIGATGRLGRDLTVDGNAHVEFAPGASTRGVDGRVSWQPRDPLRLRLEGGTLERPLEFRFQEAGITWLGAAVDVTLSSGWRVGATVQRYWESRDRPDAGAFDWNQWRLGARISLLLRSEPDVWTLPPGRREGER
jgi:hypothetical protein